MNECTHIGLDVHKDTIAVAILRPSATEVDERVIPNTSGSDPAAACPPRSAPHGTLLRGRTDRVRHTPGSSPPSALTAT